MWGQKNLPKNCVMDFFASQTISFRSWVMQMHWEWIHSFVRTRVCKIEQLWLCSTQKIRGKGQHVRKILRPGTTNFFLGVRVNFTNPKAKMRQRKEFNQQNCVKIYEHTELEVPPNFYSQCSTPGMSNSNPRAGRTMIFKDRKTVSGPQFKFFKTFYCSNISLYQFIG